MELSKSHWLTVLLPTTLPCEEIEERPMSLTKLKEENQLTTKKSPICSLILSLVFFFKVRLGKAIKRKVPQSLQQKNNQEEITVVYKLTAIHSPLIHLFK